MVGKVQGLGAELGIDINPDKQGTAQTFDAHRLVKAAESAGLGAQMVERLHRAHFTEGLDVGDKAVLRVLAGEAGMVPEKAAQVLDSDAYAREVEEDEQRARDYEISGVPFTVVNGRYAVGGAQSEKAFRKVLEEAVKNA
jgi:predicted DsbA family dithiol-disulfide isomerase